MKIYIPRRRDYTYEHAYTTVEGVEAAIKGMAMVDHACYVQWLGDKPEFNLQYFMEKYSYCTVELLNTRHEDVEL